MSWAEELETQHALSNKITLKRPKNPNIELPIFGV